MSCLHLQSRALDNAAITKIYWDSHFVGWSEGVVLFVDCPMLPVSPNLGRMDDS